MRPVRPSSALVPVGLAVALLAAASGPALGATAAGQPAAGSSTSALTVLTLSAADQQLRAGVVELLAETLTDPAASVTVTPLLAGGTPYGRQTVTAGGAPTTVPSRDSAELVPALAGLASVATPAFGASAGTSASGATSQVGSTGLGAVRLLGLPVRLEGTLGAVSTVAGSGSLGEQALDVDALALPSIADLLAALGIDLSALPVEVLYQLLDELDLVTTTVTELKRQLDAGVEQVQAQVDDAQQAVDDAADALVAERAELDPALAQVRAAETALAAEVARVALAQQAVDTARGAAAAAATELADAEAALSGRLAQLGLTRAVYDALLVKPAGVEALIADVEAAQAAATSATAVVTGATTALTAAEGLEEVAAAAVATAEAAVTVVQGLIDAAQELLDETLRLLDVALQTVLPQIAKLLAAVTAVLDGTPLVSLRDLDVVARTTVTSAAPGGQQAEIVGGRVTGLEVLGTDVLQDVLGKTTVELTEITSDQLDAVGALVDQLTGTLSDVLSDVPGFPVLEVPAPKVQVLQGTTGTGVSDGFGTATAGVQLLAVELPSITLPLGLQLPDAAGLPALGALPGNVRTSALGDLTSVPVSLAVGSLGPQSRFRPAVAATGTPGTGTPTTGTPTAGVPTTGTPAAGTPTTGTPAATGTPVAGTPTATAQQLPRTGATALVALMGLALLGTGLWLRRRPEVGALDL